MVSWLSRCLLPVFQFTRVGLVLTAVADALAGMLLAARFDERYRDSVFDVISWGQLGMLALCSACLYSFGMSLNDLVDRRRDARLAPHRPLPSGRLGVISAHLICGLLGALTCIVGWWVAIDSPMPAGVAGVLAGVMLLILFYNLVGKYLVALGLLALGLIRAGNASLGAGDSPMLWHGLLLFNHVVIISTLAYRWERKRPQLSMVHVALVVSGLAFINGGLVGSSLLLPMVLFPVDARLLAPAGATIAFAVWSVVILRSAKDQRERGQKLVLLGLLWLIVHDAALVATYVAIWAGLGIFLMLPLAWVSVQLLRGWSQWSGKTIYRQVR